MNQKVVRNKYGRKPNQTKNKQTNKKERQKRRERKNEFVFKTKLNVGHIFFIQQNEVFKFSLSHKLSEQLKLKKKELCYNCVIILKITSWH